METHTLLVDNQNDTTTKAQTHLRNENTGSHKHLYTIFFAALFTVALNWIEPKSVSSG